MISDSTITDLIIKETARQGNTLSLIPSENYASPEVRAALGSALTNKYSEGYPGKRYYNGNEIVDQIETIAIDRAKKLFGVPHANVQPYSGSPANSAVYMGLLAPGDTIMGLKLAGGGHLTHGHKVTFSGKFFRSVQYDVDENGLIDHDAALALAKAEKPKIIVVGTTAYPRILDWEKWRSIADEVGAILLADISHIAGLVVSQVHPSPVPFADVVMTTTHKTLRGPRGAMIMVTDAGLKKDPDMGTKIDKAVFPGLQGGPHDQVTAGIAIALGEAVTPEFRSYGKQVVANAKALAQTLLDRKLTLVTGGTDNHLMVVDLRPQKKTGKEIADSLEEIGIVVNRNSVPHDSASPFDPSGIRLGTPAVTTRGMKEAEMKLIGGWISAVVENKNIKSIQKDVEGITKQFPLP